jgi:cation transport regulator ChaB
MKPASRWQLPQELPTRHSLRQTAQQFGKQVMSPALDPFAEASKELQDGLKASITEVKQVANEVDTSLKTTEAHPEPSTLSRRDLPQVATV